MHQIPDSYAGYDCVKLENAALALWITQNVGPRIIGLEVSGGSNLMAVVPEAHDITPAGKTFWFRGGHRLWHAPEHAERTYAPDDAPVTITPIENGVQVVQAVDADTGIEKQMTITLPDETARVVIDHTLVNRGLWSVELAPWGITQLKPGGFAVLPQNSADSFMLPNRHLALWPYTRLDAPHLQLGNRYLFVHATMIKGERLKIGWANTAGWLGYYVDETLFVKEAEKHDPAASYYDFGSSAECYCNHAILELETLAPRTTLAPGESVSHREVWRLYPNIMLTATELSADSIENTLLT